MTIYRRLASPQLRTLYAGGILLGALLASLLAGCALPRPSDFDPTPLDASGLPTPDMSVQLPQLGPCTDASEQAFSLDSSKPVTVLVHGCNGSAGRFRSLAQLYAFHGQQAVCFSYDDRASMVQSSAQLAAAVGALTERMRNRDITIIGHSMGGLIARKALEGERRIDWERDGVNLNLVTVSAPVSGIAVANTCGYRSLHWASLGMVPLTCWAITGDNWHEITGSSDFIRRPGPLLASVRHYVKVVTDERGACRRRDAKGTCLESDDIFSLAEQYQPIIDGYPRLANVQVAAGHVAIVGYQGVAPRQLISILQQQGLLAATAAGREDALERLMAKLY
ncbi:esterase/lipase family protein [Roseateles oligotrophus]|uniref:Alpha/beta hydrolase n=1 Tax=Roseateles oligotrophus TaxID=1769250 RepID=A0ABT2YLC6_9BURK|nr:alpha/beta hydrolase [Roseateles oligotrophus]MCV2370741.1 alpha/beta hydrolase [Roseateles oligotrophus]